MNTSGTGVIVAGWGASDITPSRTSELYGQYYQRVATAVRDPLGVVALALEQSGSGAAKGQAILVSCDQTMIDRSLVEKARGMLGKQIPDFDATRLVVNATHTHSAPSAFDTLKWWKHDPACLSFEECSEVLVEAVVHAAVTAWTGRTPSLIGMATGRASVGHCRRPVYRDGSAEMYGVTNRPDFAGMESGEDDTIGVIGVWNAKGTLTGLVVNVVCPSQVMEATYVVSADMYGEMRRQVRTRMGDDPFILCQIGAAGDQAPRDLTTPYRGGPTFWDEEGMVELGGRLADAVMEAVPRAKEARSADTPLYHDVVTPRLPLRMVSPQVYAQSVAELFALTAREPADECSPGSAYSRFVAKIRNRESLHIPGPYDDKNDDFVLMRNLEAVVERFQEQRTAPTVAVEVHVLRLGDTAISTSPFELFLDYGQRIRARSPAALTLHVELACDSLGYLPTERAATCGGYGALVANGKVGPEGGAQFIELVLERIATLFGR